MFEKVNPQHPDKVADRIAGAIVDLAYAKSENPKVAAEVLLGHGQCSLQIETSERLTAEELEAIVHRIAGEEVEVRALIVPQDVHLADNQAGAVRCGDNGIFRGCAQTHEQKLLTAIATSIYDRYPTDGKYLLNLHKDETRKDHYFGDLTICQSHATDKELQDWLEPAFIWNGHRVEINDSEDKAKEILKEAMNGKSMLEEIRHVGMHYDGEKDYTDYHSATWDYTDRGNGQLISTKSCSLHTTINPLGPWTGGTDVDCGATNRKLGSDMGDGVTGGGLHGKDLSKADVSVNIWAYLESIRTGREVTACCSIGDETVCGIPYSEIVEQARLYIHTIGGFERFAEWGLIRHKDY